MATLDDVRRIATQLPGAIEAEDEERFGLSVMIKGKAKGFVWAWAERIHPKKPKVINNGVLAIVVPDLAIKEILLNSDSPGLFTEPHYNGFPAILVRLEEVRLDELEDLVVEAWRAKAPAPLVAEFDAQGGPSDA